MTATFTEWSDGHGRICREYSHREYAPVVEAVSGFVARTLDVVVGPMRSRGSEWVCAVTYVGE